MGFFGDIFNAALSPIGIKPFPGGPYSDNSAGDKMQGNLAQYMQALGPVIAQIAQQAGVGNPLSPGDTGAYSTDLYGLNPLQQGAVNKQASLDRTSKDAIMSKIKANLTARGMGNSSTMAAAEAYLDQQLSSQLGSERIQAGENAYQNRNQALQQISALLGQQYGAQQGVTQYQGQVAQSAHAEAMQNLGGLIALGLYAGGAGPFGRSATPQAGGGGLLPGGVSAGGVSGGGYGAGFGAGGFGAGGFGAGGFGGTTVPSFYP